MTTTIGGSYPAVNSDSDATINGLTVGKGGGAVSTNTAVGSGAGQANTTGGSNLFAGYQAGYTNTTGQYSTMVGYQAGYTSNSTSGIDAYGYASLRSNTTGEYNAGYGQSSLRSNTTGTYNVGIGHYALYSNTTASNNTAVGYQAGYGTTTAQYNVFVGSRQGSSGNGEGNTIIGDFAGNARTSGTYNTFVGQSSGYLMTTGSKNIILGGYSGNNGGLDIRTLNNHIVLSDGDGNPRCVWNASGYFKQSNNVTYVGLTDPTNEFNNSADFEALAIVNRNNSLSRRALLLGCTRSPSSAYSIINMYSGDGASNPYVDQEFNLRGDGNAYADGTWNNNGADYAEYFESSTGVAIPVGSTVVLENNKVRLATNSDNSDSVIGVVRPKEPGKASMMVGNTAWNKWANKYLTDDFDRFIMEDHNVIEWTDEGGKEHSYESQSIPVGLVVPSNAVIKTHDANGVKLQHYKINPAWNPDSEYVNRENRDEWLIIGLIGQVKVLKGQVMGDRWIKMQDVSSSVEEWFIK
jgi:hypothetical protein